MTLKLPKKSLIIVAIIFQMTVIKSQQLVQYPKEDSLNVYIKERTNGIIRNLYDLSIGGKIPAYLRDSLNIKTPSEILKILGGYIDSNGITVPFDRKNISGLWFLRTIQSSLFQSTQVLELSAIALLFKPTYNGFIGNDFPICWIKLSDIKNVVDSNDYKFLLLLGNYASLNNQVKFHDNNWSPNQQISVEGKQYIKIDSSFLLKMSKMIVSGRSYFSIWQYAGRDNKKEKPFPIFDYQLNKYIGLYETGHLYPDSVLVLYGNRDSMIEYARYPTYCDSIIINSNYQIIGLNTFIRYYNSNKTIYYRFRIDASAYRNFEGGRVTLWYLEDYLRWKKKYKNGK